MHPSKLSRVRTLAFCQSVLLLPASVFLAAAALRLLQPRPYEPARTSWVIFEWTQGHVSRSGAAVLFLFIPLVATVAGLVTLSRAWRESEALRQDVLVAVGIVRQYVALLLLTTATAWAGAILVFAVAHIWTD